MRGTAGGQLNGGINPFHNLGRFLCRAPVFGGCFLTDLPRTIHFVSDTPELHRVRFRVTVRGPPVAQIGSTLVVTIFDKLSRFIWTSGSEIDPKHWLGP